MTDVSEHINPFTQEPIPQVDADEWESMSLIQLYDQLQIMESRREVCVNMGKAGWLLGMDATITRIKSIIATKERGVTNGII